MPKFDPLTTLETGQDHPLQQYLMRKIKDDFDNHQSRIGGTDGIAATIHASHFDKELFSTGHGYKTFAIGGGGSVTLPAGAHIARMSGGFDNSFLPKAWVKGILVVRPNGLPFFKCRFRHTNWANVKRVALGLLEDRVGATLRVPLDGVFYNREQDRLPEFVCQLGAVNNVPPSGQGVAITTFSESLATPSANEWVTIQIEYVTPKICECRFNDQLIIAFASSLGDHLADDVISRDMNGMAFYVRPTSFSGSDNLDVDRMEYGSLIIADAA